MQSPSSHVIAVIARDRKCNSRLGRELTRMNEPEANTDDGVTASQWRGMLSSCDLKKKGQPMRLIFSVFLVVTVMSVLSVAQETISKSSPDAAELNKMAARFAPTRLVVDTSALSAGDKQALVKLIEAARIVNTLFMKQFWSGDLALYHKLQQDKTPLGNARLHYFWINKGPWSEIDQHKAFLPGVPEHKPAGANFYPENMTKEEFENWVKTLSPAEKEQAEGFFTVVRRDANGKLKLVPYSQEYKPDLDQAGKLLREAAALTGNATLKKFLNSRADAFASNDYYQSDIDWMDLDARLDVTFGPYETYNDELFGYKAAFEAYINLRDEKESTRLAFLSQHLQDIEDNLPEDPKYRVAKLGAA